MSKRPPTIRDVASHAGVSVATVSRVLNRSALVKDSTRQVVESAIETLEYSPSWLARDLRQERTGRALVLLPSLHSPVMADVFRGVDEVARAAGYYPLISPTARDQHRENELVALVSNRIVDGVIFFGTTLSSSRLDDLAQRHCVVQCAEWREGSSAAHVSIDDYRAAIDLTDHLIELGHTSIAMISDRDEFSGRLRENGFRTAMRTAGLPVDETLVVDGDYEFATGRRIAEELFLNADRPTAIVCISDVVAAGVITEVRRIGLRVPQDVAIASFDDSREALMTTPPITTIRQPFVEIGRVSMCVLLDQINQKDGAKGQTISLPHELIVRGSTVPGHD